MRDRLVDRVGRLQGVDAHHVLQVVDNKLLQQLQLRLDGLHTQVLHIGGKPFIEPEVCPPGWSHQVTCHNVMSHFLCH